MFDVDKVKGLILVEKAEGVTVEELKAATGCKFTVSPNLAPMRYSDA